MPKFEVSGQILPKITERMEVAGYKDRDIMAVRAVVIYEGISNDDRKLEISRDDLERAIPSLEGKPVRIRFIDNDPTGHGYDPNTGRFDDISRAVGYIHWAWGEVDEASGKLQAICEMAIWQNYYPEICNRLRQLHQSGDLKFSFEMERDYEITPEGNKRLFNIHFTGVAIVKNPAFEETKSLLVAELINNKEGKEMDYEKLYNELMVKHTEMSNKLTLAEKQVEDLTKDVTTTKEELAEAQGTIKTVSAERDTFKDKVESAEKERIGKERLAKLTKYGEPEKTEQELAEMSQEEFVNALEEAVTNYVPTGNENAENDDLSGVHFDSVKVNKKKTDRKTALMELVAGLSK